MKFALVENARTTAEPKQRGTCTNCGEEMIAKCGRTKVWHWAHKSREMCDPWWENETEWHRAWKSQFPEDWQEIVHVDQLTGERHLADVKSAHGLVIEFQHSPIQDEERVSREQFYGDMIWIVDALRGELNASYFQMGLHRDPLQRDPLAYQLDWYGRNRILHNWSASEKRVFLDFGDAGTSGPPVVWRLIFFDPKRRMGAVAPYHKRSLIRAITEGGDIGVPYLPDEAGTAEQTEERR